MKQRLVCVWVGSCSLRDKLLDMNGALAIGTLVSCILEIVDAEWNQTATEREAKETHATANQPCAQARLMLDFCHCLLMTIRTLDQYRLRAKPRLLNDHRCLTADKGRRWHWLAGLRVDYLRCVWLLGLAIWIETDWRCLNKGIWLRGDWLRRKPGQWWCH